MGNKARVIAVCGKGGVGKTFISASITRILVEDKGLKVLAVDADPASGLALALGFNPEITVDDIRCGLIEKVRSGGGGDREEIVKNLEYEVFRALCEKDNLAFLAVGRPENDGCYCQVNIMLREIIETLAGSFDFIVIDGEAGVEQVNRRVMSAVTDLLLVSDTSLRGIRVAGAIKGVADRVIGYERAGLVLNRIGKLEEGVIPVTRPEIPVIGLIPEDNDIRVADMKGKNMLEVPITPAITAVKELLDNLYFDRLAILNPDQR
ncbi:MAG: AAA family ATPase [Bacillota bacterium]